MVEKAVDIDAYIGTFDGFTRDRLIEMRALVNRLLPGSTEVISYAIPCFKLGKHSVTFFAGYKKHIGMYPMPEGDADFQERLAAYKSGASTARFPHTKPLPVDLIELILKHRVAELLSDGH